MRRRFDYGIIGVSLLVLFEAARAPAQDTALTEILSSLSTNIAAVHSIETSFVQEKHLSVLDHVVTLKGKIYMVKPDRLAWHVVSPIRYSIVLEEGTVRQWDGETKSETRLSIEKNPVLQMAIDQMRQWFSGDYLRLRSEYRITLTQQQPIELTFVPLNSTEAGKYIERVSVRFRNDNRYVTGIMVEEKGGDRTDIRFHDTRLDQDIPSIAWDVRFPAMPKQ